MMNIPCLLSILLALLVIPGTSEGFCPGGCSCNDSSHVVHCSDAGLDIIPGTLSPYVKKLYLQHNRIKRVDAAFQFYVQLILADFSHNELDSLADRCFASSPQLKELRLDNNRLENLNNLTFSGLKALETLSIRKNLIQNLTSSLFENLSQLKILDLGENPIHFIDESAFDSLFELRDLRLDHNALSSIPPFPPSLSQNLIKLRLSYSKDLKSSAGSPFSHLSNVLELNLKGSGLTELPLEAFNGLASLRTLDISSNKLKVIPCFSLSLANLRELFIGGANSYSDVPSFAFQGLSGLRFLDITQSENLRVIRTRSFYGNPSLKTLDLSEAQIPQMRFEDEALLIKRNSTEEKLRLILRSMGLRSLNEGSVPNWTLSMESIDLQGNTLKCDCRLNWLVDYISTSQSEVHALCSNGKHLGQGSNLTCSSLSDIQEDEEFVQLYEDEENDETSSDEDFKTSESQAPNIFDYRRRHEKQIVLISLIILSVVMLGFVFLVLVHFRGRILLLCLRGRSRRANASRSFHTRSSSGELCSSESPSSFSKKSHFNYYSSHLARGDPSRTLPHLPANETGLYRDFLSSKHYPVRDYGGGGVHTANNGVYTTEDDYFLQVSHDRQVIKPLPVSDL